MPDVKGPVTTRRRLRSELNRLREERGISQAQVVERLDWSISKLIRIENGTVGISVTDVRALLGVYQVPEEDIEDLVGLARVAKERRWWNGYRDTLSASYQAFIGFEAEAVRLRQFHPLLIPGLLQTEDYIRVITEVLTLVASPREQMEKRIEVRLRRQAEVIEGDNTPEFVAIIGEAALLTTVGGDKAMRNQLLHLVKIEQEYESISVAVMPFSAGPQMGMLGAFHIMDFADEADDSLLFLENARQGDVAMRDQEDVALYGQQFEKLLDLSLRGRDAVAYLTMIADRLA